MVENERIQAWPLTTREKEHSRVVVEGQRTDNAERCTVVVVHEVGGTWAWYPNPRELHRTGESPQVAC